MDQLDALRIFAAVADFKSFSAAARARGVSATAASRAINDLERALGVTLLRRTTRSVQLTHEGASYLEHCRNALLELDDAARSLRNESSEPRGLLIVTAPVVYGRQKVLPAIANLMSIYPLLNVRLMLLDRVVRLADEGVDVAIRIADLSDSALHAVRIDETRRVLVASPDYLAQHGTPSTVSDLHNHSLFVFDNFAPNGEWRFGGENSPVIHLEPRFISNSVETVIDASIAGMGIARALCYQVDDHVRNGRLVYVLPEFNPPTVPVSLVFQANRAKSPNVRALINVMKNFKSAT